MAYMGKEPKKECVCIYIYIYIYIWFTLLYTWNKHNIVNQLYSNNYFKKNFSFYLCVNVGARYWLYNRDPDQWGPAFVGYGWVTVNEWAIFIQDGQCLRHKLEELT